jgi:hypothetical protein
LRELQQKARRLQEQRRGRGWRPLAEAELASELGCPPERLAEAQAVWRALQVASLDQPLGLGQGSDGAPDQGTLLDQLASEPPGTSSDAIAAATAEANFEFEWTSLQFNVNTVSTVHQDSNNVGPLLVLLLGRFDGGAFRMADQSVLSKIGTIVAIDGRLPHYPDPFNGHRVSVIAFQHKSAQRLSAADKRLLVELGFKSRMISTLAPSDADAESVVAASPKVVKEDYNRVLIELCAGQNSRLCRPSEQNEGCYTLRITAEDDLTSARGRQKVLDVISKYHDTPILIWVSIPCTGGSTWQRINRKKESKGDRKSVV